MSGLLSTATVTTIGIVCKAVLNLGFCSVSVNGLPTLMAALESEERKGRGILTVANHISTLDDPVAWGVLPIRYFLRSSTTRWALGASDIMFTNPVFSTFFRHGQVLETFRGDGIFQPAVDVAIQKLNQGAWVHLFSEGKVNQPNTYPQTDGISHLPRFKWGIGRMLMETAVPPVVIPMWLTGFDKLMPEGRPFPFKYLPRQGVHLGVNFGDPVSLSALNSALNIHNKTHLSEVHRGNPGEEINAGASVEEAQRNSDIVAVRKEITAIVQRAVEALGRSITDDKLGAP